METVSVNKQVYKRSEKIIAWKQSLRPQTKKRVINAIPQVNREILDVRKNNIKARLKAKINKNILPTPVIPASEIQNATDKEIVVNAVLRGASITKTLQRKYTKSSKSILAEAAWTFMKDNKQALAMSLAIPTIALAGSAVVTFYVGGLSTTWLLGALGTVGAQIVPSILPSVIKDMGVSMGINLATKAGMVGIKAAISRVLKRGQTDPRPILSAENRKKLAAIGISSTIYMASVDMLMENLIKEGANFAYSGGLGGYVIGKSLQLVPGAVSTVYSGTANAIKGVRTQLSKVPRETMSALKKRWKDKIKLKVKSSSLLIDVVPVPTMQRPKTKPRAVKINSQFDSKKTAQTMITENRIMSVAVGISSALVTSYFTGHDIQSAHTLFAVINDVVGLNNLLARLGNRITTDQLKKIKTLHKKIGTDKTAVQTILREIYGQNHRQLNVSKMDREQLYLALYERNVMVKPNEDLEVMRKKLSQAQQELQGLTYLAIMESMTKGIISTGVSSATARTMDSFYVAYKDAMSKTPADLTAAEQNMNTIAPDALKQPDLPHDTPTNVLDTPQKDLDSAQNKQSVILGEVGVVTASQGREAIRAARKLRNEINDAERKAAVDRANSRVTSRKIKQTVKTEERIQILPTDEMLIPKEIQDQLKQIEFTPLLRQLAGGFTKKAIQASTSWIPGLGQLVFAIDQTIDTVNANIEAVNLAKDVTNITILGSKLLSPDSMLAQLNTVALGTRLPSIPQLNVLASRAAEALQTDKVNAYDIMLKALKTTLLEGGSGKDLAGHIAYEIAGSKDLNALGDLKQQIFGSSHQI